MLHSYDLGYHSAIVASASRGHDPAWAGRLPPQNAPQQEVFVQSGSPQAQLSDKTLMGFVVAQEDWALQMLYDRYFRRAFALAYRMLGDQAAAEDCVQDVFLKIWQQPQLYSPERGAFVSWLLTVVHHRAANQLRARRQVAPLAAPGFADDPESSPQDNLPDESPPVDEQVWIDEQRRKVRAALAELAPIQREALELAYYGGLSQSEIALQLGQPLGTVKTRIRSGLQKLRTALTNTGWYDVPS